MKKSLTLGISALAVAGAITVGTMSVSALGASSGTHNQYHGNTTGEDQGYASSLASRAQIVGMTTDELRTALQSKTMSQIALEKGMDEAIFQQKMTEAAKARWESRGLSNEEITKRLADQTARRAANQAADDHAFGTSTGKGQNGHWRAE